MRYQCHRRFRDLPSAYSIFSRPLVCSCRRRLPLQWVTRYSNSPSCLSIEALENLAPNVKQSNHDEREIAAISRICECVTKELDDGRRASKEGQQHLVYRADYELNVDVFYRYEDIERGERTKNLEMWTRRKAEDRLHQETVCKSSSRGWIQARQSYTTSMVIPCCTV